MQGQSCTGTARGSGGKQRKRQGAMQQQAPAPLSARAPCCPLLLHLKRELLVLRLCHMQHQGRRLQLRKHPRPVSQRIHVGAAAARRRLVVACRGGRGLERAVQPGMPAAANT